jgi:hypothetical protein
MFDHLNLEDVNSSPILLSLGCLSTVLLQTEYHNVLKNLALFKHIGKINRGMAGFLLDFVGPRKL